MKPNFLKTAILITSVLFATAVFGQQTQNNKLNTNGLINNQSKVKVFNGSVYANFSDQKVTSQEIVSRLNKLLKLDENHSFEQISKKNDEIGFSHINLQELYKGFPVDGHIIMLHEKDGLLQNINGNVAKLKDIDVQINISDEQAISIAMEALGVTQLFKEHPVKTVFAKSQRDNQFYLTKKVKIKSFVPFAFYDVFVDAKTGEIMKKISLIRNADVPGTAQTFFKGTQPITCDKLSETSYQLFDNARNIGTYSGATWMYYNDPVIYKNTSTNWSNNPALDVHWGMEQTYDYFFNTFQRNGYDDMGGEVTNIYDLAFIANFVPALQFNAAAMEDGIMIYGTGGTMDGDFFNPFVSLDCAAHEFTHMVTTASVGTDGEGLVYEGESGALNESFSDIFGTCIEFYANINPNWTIGEEIVPGGMMRSMSNPNVSSGALFPAQPDTYKGDYWANTSDISQENDNGGVHTNSGVQNFWFYLLCEGGTGINDLGNAYAVDGIGMDHAQHIAYRNLITYITPTSTYFDSYLGSLQAAEDLYGNSSAEYTAVQQAWYAVGIGESVICEYPTYFTQTSAAFGDGSGMENYYDNQKCAWVIAPQCAESITLTFTEFDTEDEHDFVFIYDSYDSESPLAVYSGNSIPDAVTSNTGIMIVVFESDNEVNAQGFAVSYTSTKKEICECETTLTAESGTISDGSEENNYEDNVLCVWHIAPQGANSITLTFTEFDTELGYDIVEVRDDVNGTTKQFSGSSIPSPVTVYSGKMTVVFLSDGMTNAEGWTANYTSTKPSGFEQVKENNITLFPNPAKNIVNIQFAENHQNAVIEIYDVVGKLVVRHFEKEINANSTKSFNIENIPSGIYNIIITSDTKRTNHKLLISR